MITSNPIGDRHLDLPALSSYSCLAVPTLRDYPKSAALPHYKMRGKILIRQSGFDAWIEQFRMNQEDAVKGIVRDVMSNLKGKKSDTGLIEKLKTE